MVIGCYGWFYEVIGGYGWLYVVIGGYGWLQDVIDGYKMLYKLLQDVINDYKMLQSYVVIGLLQLHILYMHGISGNTQHTKMKPIKLFYINRMNK